MKTPVKIDAKTLRQIITKEAKRLTVERLNEAPHRTPSNLASPDTVKLVSKIETAIFEAAYEHFVDMFDSEDPSMEAAGGRVAWEAQCDEAANALAEDLTNELERVARQVHANLVDGEYRRG